MRAESIDPDRARGQVVARVAAPDFAAFVTDAAALAWWPRLWTTSAPGLGLPLPHLHRDSARAPHICAGTAPGRSGDASADSASDPAVPPPPAVADVDGAGPEGADADAAADSQHSCTDARASPASQLLRVRPKS